MKIRLRIPLKLPLKNTLTPSYDKRAFFAYMGLKREWERAIPKAEEHQRALGPRSVRIVRLMTKPERPYDTPNVWFSCAAILDILVHGGWFVDDTPDLLYLEQPIQRYAAYDEEAPATWIEIEDVGAAVKSARLPGV